MFAPGTAVRYDQNYDKPCHGENKVAHAVQVPSLLHPPLKIDNFVSFELHSTLTQSKKCVQLFPGSSSCSCASMLVYTKIGRIINHRKIIFALSGSFGSTGSVDIPVLGMCVRVRVELPHRKPAAKLGSVSSSHHFTWWNIRIQ